jgi:FkbM family methyltransferase
MLLYKAIRILRIGDPSLVQINVPKYNYKVYCPDTIDDYINMTVREKHILDHFDPKKDDTVIDVGAHLGRYALISANKVGKGGKVIAIEANPLVFQKLNKNLELNRFTNVTSLNYAVYSTKGKIKLFFPNEGLKNTLFNTVVSDRAISSEKYIEVNADTLDNILYSLNINPMNVNWVKIDVEGAELEVLKGATNILAKGQDISLLIEIHNVSDGKNLNENIMMMLKGYNFHLVFEKIEYSGEGHIILRKQRLD